MDTGRLITRRTVMSATCVATVAAMMSPAPTAEAKADLARPRVMWPVSYTHLTIPTKA